MHYRREDGCRAWLTYALIDPSTLLGLLEEYGSAESIYDMVRSGQGKLIRERIPQSKWQILQARSQPDKMHDMMQVMNRLGMGILSIEDSAYPDALRMIPDAPVFLFYLGDLAALDTRCFTVVGSRKASVKGLQFAKTLSRDLSNSGVTIVSGFASGIDSASHTGCLEGKSPTIAVCGCGLDVNYPAANRQLRERILQHGGLLISEFAPGSPGIGWHFTVRNRIMSGLSKGTMMVECRIRSGSMSTVQHALDQGREVFAWPGEPGSEWSEGAHQLIREGARYATSAQDILEDLGWSDLSVPTKEEKKALPPLTDEQHRIMTALHQGEQTMDELALSTGLDAASLSVSLTMLQLMGLVKSLPGKTFSLI